MKEFREECITCEHLEGDEKDRAVCAAEQCKLSFTEQQIEEHCVDIEKMPEHTQQQFDGVQIIRQLQSVNKDLVQNIVLSAGEQPL